MNTDAEQVGVEESSKLPPKNAVSLFDSSAGAGDFPVLKAFQEYLENEQVKARKRMLGLSIFFIVLLVVVVVTFTLIMSTVINRNQALSDRLLDIALRERQPVSQPVVNVQQPAPQPTTTQQQQNVADSMRPLMDKLEKLIAEKQKQTPIPVTVPPATPITPEQAKIAAETKALLQQQAELKRQQEAVKAEQKKLKAEQEKLHQAEVEAHRRRLYPEFYAKQNDETSQPEAEKVDAGEEEELAKPVAVKPAKTATNKTLNKKPSAKEVKGNAAPLPQPPVAPKVQNEVKTVPAITETPKKPAPKKMVLPEDNLKTIDVNANKPITFFKPEDEDLKELLEQSRKQSNAPAASPAKATPPVANPPSKPASNVTQKDIVNGAAQTKQPEVKPAPLPANNGNGTNSSTSKVNTVTINIGSDKKNSIPFILEQSK